MKANVFVKLRVQMSNVDGVSTHTLTYPRKRKIDNDYEFVYAIDAVRKKVMKLKVGERMYFKSLRCEPDSLGIITRIE